MKRHRDYDELIAAKDAAYATFVDLAKQVELHPETKRRAAECRRRALIMALPPQLHSALFEEAWPGYGTLSDMRIQSYVDKDEHGILVHKWQFTSSWTEGGEHCCEVDMSSYFPQNDDLRFQDVFEPVEFEPNDPEAVWARALHLNDADVARALAAFCCVCCEHLSDYSAMPAQAFPTPKGKREEE